MIPIFILAAVLGASTAQQHSHPLHGICHNNHLQMTEDQVIENVVMAVDGNGDDEVRKYELLVFFADLMGVVLPPEVVAAMANMTSDELLALAANMNVERHTFIQAWHTRFHDSMEFVAATFDAFDTDGNGMLSSTEIEGIVDRAIATGDVNGDGELHRVEFIAFLEHIYKNC